jgi:multicomponent Na+:H+ antiporter subunit G
MALLLEVVSWVLLVSGGLFCIVGAFGLVRMPDFYTRMHAASVVDTGGAGLLLAGMLLQAGLSLVSVKLAMIALLLFFTSPTATHALGRAALTRGVDPQLADEEGGPSKP